MAEGCQVPPLLWTPPQLRRAGSSTCVSIFCAQVHLGCPRDHHHPGSTTYQSGNTAAVDSGPTSNISCEFKSPPRTFCTASGLHSLFSLFSHGLHCPWLCRDCGLLGNKDLNPTVWAPHISFLTAQTKPTDRWMREQKFPEAGELPGATTAAQQSSS